MVEVADTTVRVDRKKALTYAGANIPEYWILDINQQQVYQFCQPQDNKYQQERILSGDIVVSLVSFPEIEVPISRLFP
ncbi:Uma2 family endonuclease [Gloeothece verrucosa]|uniref:Uma2 family endonuclease n=1 Tax=Gloeothece verrucosa TaxID=2546359 RepID=UPI0002D5EB28|nr:Uma2 family endonuclease [Gloeothece verrucosa]